MKNKIALIAVVVAVLVSPILLWAAQVIINGANVQDNTLGPLKLNITGASPTVDNVVPMYDNATGRFRWETAPTFTHVGARSLTVTDNADGNGTADLKNWRDAYINRNIIGNSTGYIQGYSFGSASYTDNGYFNDLITKSPWVDVRAYLPEGYVTDGSVDYISQVNQAIDNVYASGGGTILIPIRIGILSPILLKDGVNLVGLGKTKSRLIPLLGFVGDAVIKSSRRDDNNPNNYDFVTVTDLMICAPLSSASAFYALDITGFRASTFARLWLQGSGTSTLNQTAVRVADYNPSNTSSKSTFFNRLESIDASGNGWNRFLFMDQIHGNSNHNEISGFNSYSRVGIEFGSYSSGGGSIGFTNGYLLGDGTYSDNATNLIVKGGIPVWSRFYQVGGEGFGDTASNSLKIPNTLTASYYYRRGYSIDVLNMDIPLSFGGSGSTKTTSLYPNQGTGTFFTSAYFRIPQGTGLVAGASNTFNYTLSDAETSVLDSFLIIPVSGLPDYPVSFQGTVSGTTFTLKASISDNTTLSSNLVVRVINIGLSNVAR